MEQVGGCAEGAQAAPRSCLLAEHWKCEGGQDKVIQDVWGGKKKKKDRPLIKKFVCGKAACGPGQWGREQTSCWISSLMPNGDSGTDRGCNPSGTGWIWSPDINLAAVWGLLPFPLWQHSRTEPSWAPHTRVGLHSLGHSPDTQLSSLGPKVL